MNIAYTIECIYFKPSGKYYTSAEETFAGELFEGCIYPSEFGRRLLKLRKLPGLASGVWRGPFTCSVNKGYEDLILP